VSFLFLPFRSSSPPLSSSSPLFSFAAPLFIFRRIFCNWHELFSCSSKFSFSKKTVLKISTFSLLIRSFNFKTKVESKRPQAPSQNHFDLVPYSFFSDLLWKSRSRSVPLMGFKCYECGASPKTGKGRGPNLGEGKNVIKLCGSCYTKVAFILSSDALWFLHLCDFLSKPFPSENKAAERRCCWCPQDTSKSLQSTRSEEARPAGCSRPRPTQGGIPK